MISIEDIVTINISASEMSFVKKMALKAELGGQSSIRDREDRIKSLEIDQLVGQIGTYAGSKFLLGDTKDYRVSRWYANQNKWSGDAGSDITGANVDFKTSLVRKKERDILDYRLLVRPKEYHENWVYILNLVTSLNADHAEVKIVGWASSRMLPPIARDGLFAGAHVLSAKELNPIPPYCWWK